VDGYGPATYGDGMADIYDDWYGSAPDVIATVEAIAQLAGDRRVLELGIGTGRLAIPLAERGVAIAGVDASAAMVERLRAKSGTAIPVTIGDMAYGLPPGPFGLVFVAYNTLFNLLSAADQRACFQAVAARLDEDGVFAVEAFVPDDPPRSGSTVTVRSLEADRVVLDASIHDPDEQRAEGQYIELSPSAGVRLRPWAIRYAPPAELDAMADQAGLVLSDRWATWSGEPFTETSAHHVSVYRATAPRRT
jgi:SAM-dependent methyltransferase